MPRDVRDEAERLYELWQLDARQRGRTHDFLRAITRARAAADVAEMSAERWDAVAPTAHQALEEARRILNLALARA